MVGQGMILADGKEEMDARNSIVKMVESVDEKVFEEKGIWG